LRRHAKTLRSTLTGTALATVAGAALALPAVGAGAVAALQDDVLTSAPLTDIPTRIAAVKATKAKVTRVDVLWSLVAPNQPANPTDPADPAYDWSRLDAIFVALDKANITPIVDVYSTPTWAVAGKNTPFPSQYNPNAPRPDAYADFMQALATRYNGAYPNPTPGALPASLPRIRHIEIWNEPNLKNFFRFNNGTSIPKYTQLVKAAYPRIKAANRRAIVIAGVSGPRSSNGGGSIGSRTWQKKILNDKSVKFDAYSMHIYPSLGPNVVTSAFPSWASLPEILDTLNKKRPGMKLYITEAGYTTAATPFRNVKVSPSKQNLFLKQLFKLKDLASPTVAAVVWFNLQDNPSWPGGLLFADGRRKPSHASFVREARKPIPAKLRSVLAN
jgi:hypothetical protein